MNLQTILYALNTGELSQVAIGGGSTKDGMNENHRTRLIPHIQLGLNALYKRFKLKESEVWINLLKGDQTYYLDCKYLTSSSDTSVPVKYLEDSVDYPFTNRLLKIERVYGNDGTEIVLNKRDFGCSVRTRTKDSIFVPDILSSDKFRCPALTRFRVEYSEDHPLIDCREGPYDPCSVDIELPDAYLQALLFFVGSRIMNPIGMTDEFHAGSSYAAKYENECAKLEDQNYEIDNIGCQLKFEDSGFV